MVSYMYTQAQKSSDEFRCKHKRYGDFAPAFIVVKMSDKEESKNDDIEVMSTAAEPEFAKPEKQEARAFLRERFLRFVNGCVGKKADFHLYENSHVSGEFRGCDVDFLEIYVRGLETPLGKVPEAILRATDVISIDINEIIAS